MAIRKLTAAALFICMVTFQSKADDKKDAPKKIQWELGLPLATSNTPVQFSALAFRSTTAHFVNGIQVRATGKHLGYRFSSSVINRVQKFVYAMDCMPGGYQKETVGLLQTSIGAQVSLLKQSHLLYVFADFNYHFQQTKGEMNNWYYFENPTRYTINSHMVGGHMGVGSRIKLGPMYITPEIGFNRLWANTLRTTHYETSHSYRTHIVGSAMVGRLSVSFGF